MIQFESVFEEAVMTGPGGEPMVQRIEHRRDPLTLTVASFNGFLGEKARAFLGTADLDALRQLEEKTRPNCPFCAALEKGTRFPADFCPGGLVRRGDSLGVPNLFSKAGLDAVVIVNHRRHELFPDRIPAADFGHAVAVGAELVRLARDRYGLPHHLLGMNFLHPGGSSVPHPHLQANARSLPYSGVQRLAALSRHRAESAGRSYWEDLLENERGSGRWLGATGRVQWLVPFAPAHQKEVWGLLPGAGSLTALDEGTAADFGEGIARVVAFYQREGHYAFTFAFFSWPEANGGFPLQVRLCARPAFKPLYANYDTWFAPKFVGDEVHTVTPEEYGARLAESFR
jgi:galactose-1-phosphate uridylyltransferase